MVGSAAYGLSRVPLLRGGSYDLVILNARVMDPETKLDAIRNVGIRSGRIATITKNSITATVRVDGTGLVLCPGFIDPIAHGQDLENDLIQVQDGVTTKLQMEVGALEVAKWYEDQKGNRICNFGCAASHVRTRSKVLNDKDVAASDSEIAQMKVLVNKGLLEGGLGVGFGLEYQPAASRWEVLEMFRVAGQHKASCHVHARYGTLIEELSVLQAIEEIMAASLISGAPVHMVHVPSMALGKTNQALAMIEQAQARGFDMTCDAYPYTAFGTGIDTEVFAPGWQEKFGISYGDLEWAKTHERLTKETFEKYQKEGGMVLAHAIPESAVELAVKSKATMIGSDGGFKNGVGHPRGAGTFSRVLGRYVREKKLLSLMEAIGKMTLRPAKRFEKRCEAFRFKGRVQVGADADLVLFDPSTILDRATYDKPTTPSVGIAGVWIHGVRVVSEGKVLEGRRPGVGLRAPISR